MLEFDASAISHLGQRLGNFQVTRLEGARQPALQFAIGQRRFQTGAVFTDPGPATRRLFLRIGQDKAGRRNSQPHEFLARAGLP